MDRPGKKIGYWSVEAIGVRGMVGGGIFAVLGDFLCLGGALASLIRYNGRQDPAHVWVLAAMLVLAFVVEGADRLW